jgi:pimeloyl-ACP methyl ester carboxylesterase
VETIDRRLASGWSVSGTGAHEGTTLTHESGISSTAGFLSTDRGRLFAVRHQPVGEPQRAVVVCSSILAEAIRSQRRELALGWELSAAGAAVARFHYLGAGNSDGATESMTFDGLVADARAVASSLQEETGLVSVDFVGTRLGALVAAAAAAHFPGGSLVVWEPPIDLGRYYNEIFRARMIGLLKRGERSPGGKAFMDAFARDGVIDVVGNPLPYSLYETTIGLDIGELLIAAGPRPILAIQMSVKPDIRPGLVALVERCAEAGVPVEPTSVHYDEAWWFGASGYTFVEVESGALDAIPATVDWLRGEAP